MILNLKSNDYLRLIGARGTQIEVLRGRVWVTEDGRAADRFLAAGGRYRVFGDGLVLVGAEAPAGAPGAEISITGA
jgi:ferric-dicitrate binding protein FerR (iron transport regulator)